MVRIDYTIYRLAIANQKLSGDWKKLQSQAGVSDEDMKHFLSYAAQFMGNAGNFK